MNEFWICTYSDRCGEWFTWFRKASDDPTVFRRPPFLWRKSNVQNKYTKKSYYLTPVDGSRYPSNVLYYSSANMTELKLSIYELRTEGAVTYISWAVVEWKENWTSIPMT